MARLILKACDLSGVRLCWELEEPDGPKGGTPHGCSFQSVQPRVPLAQLRRVCLESRIVCLRSKVSKEH